MNKIPFLRDDLQIYFFEEGGNPYVLLSDIYQFAPEPMVLHQGAYEILTYFAGDFSKEELTNELKNNSFEPDLIEGLFVLINQLDEAGFMVSQQLNNKKALVYQEYSKLTERPPLMAGSIYPNTKEEISKFLNEFLNKSETKNNIKYQGIIAPHIDLRLTDIVSKAYSEAYSSIPEDTDLFVIFGTSHFSNSGNFIATQKNYRTPLGTAEIDLDILNDLKDTYYKSFVIDDIVHKYEHSIEFHILMLQHKFSGKKIRILPLICSIPICETPEENKIALNLVNQFIEQLKETISLSEKKVFYIASADFSHIGRKFDDDFDAVSKINEMKISDKVIIDTIINDSADNFLKSLIDNNNKWRVCGLAPIFSILKMLPKSEKQLLEYNYNIETETNSAVSFATISFK